MKREVIQKRVAPTLNVALDAIEKALEFKPTDRNEKRRLYRAIVAIAATRLLDDGAPPALCAMEAVRAVSDEVEARMNAGLHAGQPFGPVPTGSA